MKRLIAYEPALERMRASGFRSLYHNSGAFGFEQGAVVKVAGWVGPEDLSIREELRGHVRRVGEPYDKTLAGMVRRAWERLLPGELWLMPKSHWAYELDFGNGDWLPAALKEVGVEAEDLRHLTNAAAIEFMIGEAVKLESFLGTVFQHLRQSDFMLAFPGRPALCTIHHHRQAWWQTTDAAIAEALQSTHSSS